MDFVLPTRRIRGKQSPDVAASPPPPSNKRQRVSEQVQDRNCIFEGANGDEELAKNVSQCLIDAMEWNISSNGCVGTILQSSFAEIKARDAQSWRVSRLVKHRRPPLDENNNRCTCGCLQWNRRKEFRRALNKKVNSIKKLLDLIASFGYKAILDLLFDSGICDRSRDVSQALLKAASNGHEDACEVLLARGTVDMDVASGALCCAATNGHEGVCEILLSCGVDPAQAVSSTAISDISMCESLVRMAGTAYVSRALLDASAQGEKHLVEILVRSPYSVDFAQALCVAASKGHRGVCECLLHRGRMDMHLVALQSGVNASERIDDKGDDEAAVKCRDERALSTRAAFLSRALEFACGNGHKSICVDLLAAIEDVFEWSSDYEVRSTLERGDHLARGLHEAAQNGHKAVCLLLLKRILTLGSALDMSTALCDAAARGHKGVCRVLLVHGADPSRAVGPAAHNGHAGVCRVLLQDASKVTVYQLSSALSQAARNGHKDVCKLLLSHGLAMGMKVSSLALYYAACNGHKDVCQCLLKSEVPKSAPDLALALNGAADNGHGDVRDMLLAYCGRRESKGTSPCSTKGGFTADVLSQCTGG